MKKSGMARKAMFVVHRVQHVMYQKLHHVCHKTEHMLHSAYMGMVAYEAHGYYRYAALGTFVVILLLAFMGGGAATAAEVMEEVEEV